MLVYSARPDVKVKFDWLAMLGTAFTLCIVGTAALLPLAISEWGPARNYAQTRIESQKADAMYSALTPNPALKAKLNSLNVEVRFFHEPTGTTRCKAATTASCTPRCRAPTPMRDIRRRLYGRYAAGRRRRSRLYMLPL